MIDPFPPGRQTEIADDMFASKLTLAVKSTLIWDLLSSEAEDAVAVLMVVQRRYRVGISRDMMKDSRKPTRHKMNMMIQVKYIKCRQPVLSKQAMRTTPSKPKTAIPIPAP